MVSGTTLVVATNITPRDDDVAAVAVIFVDDPLLVVASVVSLTVCDVGCISAVVGEPVFVAPDITLVRDDFITPSLGISLTENEVLGITVVTGASVVVASLPSLPEDGVVDISVVFGATFVLASDVPLTEDDVVTVIDAVGSSLFVASDASLTKDVIVGDTTGVG